MVSSRGRTSQPADVNDWATCLNAGTGSAGSSNRQKVSLWVKSPQYEAIRRAEKVLIQSKSATGS